MGIDFFQSRPFEDIRHCMTSIELVNDVIRDVSEEFLLQNGKDYTPNTLMH